MRELNYEGDAKGAVQYFRANRGEFRTPRRVLVHREGTRVMDINGDRMRLVGLTLDSAELPAFLKQVGASYNPELLKNLKPEVPSLEF